MNDNRRSMLRSALKLLDDAYNYISRSLDEEQDSLDNVPENLQYGERYEAMEEFVSYLEDAIDNLDNARDNIESVLA